MCVGGGGGAQGFCAGPSKQGEKKLDVKCAPLQKGLHTRHCVSQRRATLCEIVSVHFVMGRLHNELVRFSMPPFKKKSSQKASVPVLAS